MLDPKDIPLRDIHLPEPIGWWPLAPAWWAVFGGVLLCALGGFLVWRQRRRTRVRRAAQTELAKIKARFAAEADQMALARALSSWCRRVGIALGRAPDLTGDAWLAELDRIGSGDFFAHGLGRCLQEAPYRASVELDASALLAGLEAWVAKLPPAEARAHHV